MSARDKKLGSNLASFTPDVFKMNNARYIDNMQNWHCIANQKVIEFIQDEILNRKKHEFFKEEFEY